MARKPDADHPPIDPDYAIPAYPRIDADNEESGKFAPLARRLRRPRRRRGRRRQAVAMSFSRWRPGHTARLLHQQAQFAEGRDRFAA